MHVESVERSEATVPIATTASTAVNTLESDQRAASLHDIPKESSKLKLHLSGVLECPICLSLLCEPITIQCGHSFCRVCLVKCLRAKKECVICRAECTTNAQEARENVAIRNVCTSLHPDIYALRHKEALLEKRTWDDILPVFFYSQVLTCGESVQFHFYEPRYRLMMRRVMCGNKQFGYCHVENMESLVGNVALVLEVQEAHFLNDGRCLVKAMCIFPRRRIVSCYEEANSGGLHLAELASLRDDPPAITAVTSTDQHSQIPAAASRYTARAQQEGLDQLLQRRAATIELRQLERQCAALLKSIYELINSQRTFPLDTPLPPRPGSESSSGIFLSAEVEHVSLLVLGACKVYSYQYDSRLVRSGGGGMITTDDVNRCTGSTKLAMVSSVNTLNRLQTVHKWLQYDTRNSRIGVVSTAVGLMYNLVSGWMSTSDRTSRSNSNTSGDDTVSAGGVEESGGDEQDGLDDWVHINQVPMLQHESAHSGSDLDSESESDSINSASSSEFEFHDTTSYDERESHD